MMSDRAVRIITMLGICPVAAALFAIVDDSAWSVGFGRISIQYACTITIGFIVTAVILIWRKYIALNSVRRALTWGGLLPIAIQVGFFVAWPFPGFSTSRDLVVTECFALLACWLVVCPLIWWREELRGGIGVVRKINGALKMNPATVRLVIGIALALLLPCIAIITLVALDDDFGWSSDISMFVAVAIAILLGQLSWIMMWRKEIRWTGFRMIGTIVLVVLWQATSLRPFVNRPFFSMELIADTSPFWMGGVWLIGTAWLWRNKSTSLNPDANLTNELIAPACLQCGYSLRGLTEVRCPECGWTGTIDALFASAIADDV